MPKLTICLLCLCGTKEQNNHMDQLPNSMECCREGQGTMSIGFGAASPLKLLPIATVCTPQMTFHSPFTPKNQSIQEQLQMLPFPSSFPLSSSSSQDQALLWHFPTCAIYQSYIKLSLNMRTQLPLNNPKITELMDRIPGL